MEIFKMSKTRVQLDFDDDSYGQLQRLKERSGSRTNAELIRDAMSLYDWVLSKRELGWHFQIERAGEVVRLEMLGLPSPRAVANAD
jgi:hypothetical protein